DEIDFDLKTDGVVDGQFLGRGLVAGSLDGDGIISERGENEKSATMQSGLLAGRHSAAIKLDGGRRRDGLPRTVANGQSDFRTIAAKNRAFVAAVLRESWGGEPGENGNCEEREVDRRPYALPRVRHGS